MKVQTQINNSTIRNPNSALPRSWRWVRLGEVCEVKGGKRLPSGYEFSKERTSYPYIRVVDMRGVSIKMQGLKYLTSEVRGMILKYTISADNVYISIAGTIGIVGTIPIELDGANLTENAAKLVIKDKTILHRDYLWLFLSSENGQRAIKKRINLVGQPKLALFRIKTIPILLPPLPEQKRIATKIQELMQEVERARTACEKQLEAAKALPAAYLQEVFKSEEAEKWERKRLGEVCEVVTGNTPSRNFPENYGAYIPWIKPEDLDREIYVSYSKEYLSELGVTRSRALPAGAVLVSCIGNLGKTAIAGCKLATNQQINSLIPSPQINSEYLYFCCHTLQETLEILASSTTLKIVNKSIFASIEIPLPPLSVQQRIATELKEKMAEVEKIRIGIEKQLEAIDVLPQAILRKAFRGKL